MCCFSDDASFCHECAELLGNLYMFARAGRLLLDCNGILRTSRSAVHARSQNIRNPECARGILGADLFVLCIAWRCFGWEAPGRMGELRSAIYLADALCEIQLDSHCSGGPRYSVSALARNCLRGDATVALCKL